MVSRILIKLIDQSIIPAVLLLSTRLISIVLLGRYFGADFTIGYSGVEYTHPQDYLLVNSYSTFFMIAVLAVGLFYILLKSFIFHDSHISPGFTARVFSFKLSFFIQSSFDLYSQGVIWLSYLYLLMIVSGVMALFGLLYPWVFYTALVLGVVSTALFVFDVENEINLSKASGDNGTTDDFMLNFGDDYA
jgi:hypothetical protein